MRVCTHQKPSFRVLLVYATPRFVYVGLPPFYLQLWIRTCSIEFQRKLNVVQQLAAPANTVCEYFLYTQFVVVAKASSRAVQLSACCRPLYVETARAERCRTLPNIAEDLSNSFQAYPNSRDSCMSRQCVEISVRLCVCACTFVS